MKHRLALSWRSFAGFAAAALTSLPLTAHAAREPPGRAVEAPSTGGKHRLSWPFPRFRAWQYVGSVVVSGTNLYIETTAGDYPDDRIRGTTDFDVWVRRGLRLDGEQDRRTLAEVSDYMWHATQYYTVVVDSLIVPLAADRANVDVAWQMTMINWQVLGLTFLATRLTHLTVGRSRPSEYGCQDRPEGCRTAGPSFLSGHSSMSAAGAGLACAHHFAMPLYGGGFPDAAACALLGLSAVTVGTMRIAVDKHWTTDVLAGLALGGSIGFGLPWLLHYNPRLLSGGALPESMAFVPMIAPETIGMTVAGWM